MIIKFMNNFLCCCEAGLLWENNDTNILQTIQLVTGNNIAILAFSILNLIINTIAIPSVI